MKYIYYLVDLYIAIAPTVNALNVWIILQNCNFTVQYSNRLDKADVNCINNN